jgi:uncharacterized protein
MTDMPISDGKALGLVINGETEYRSSMIYLALGHSSRDTFEMIHKRGFTIEQKRISAGVRIEHPAEIINLLRYEFVQDECSARRYERHFSDICKRSALIGL